jgi:RNA polymerase sigma factor (sigma-70 family)
MSKYSRKRWRGQADTVPRCPEGAGEGLDMEAAMAQHERLIHAFIRRQGGGAISYEEALQAGRIGLWRALQKYDPSRGTAFSTYAWVAICRHIHQRVQELRREREMRPEACLPLRPAPDPEAWVERRLVTEALWELVAQLPERLRRVIIGRYGLGERGAGTLKQVGAELGLTGERVRQLQQEALAWLRHPAHSCCLRQRVGKNTASDYRQALAHNAALRRARRRRP